MPQKTGSLIEKKPLPLEDTRNQGLFLIDGQGCIIDINRTFTGLLGYRGQDIAGRHFAQLRYNISQKGDRQDEFIGSFGLFLLHQAEEQPIPLILRHKKGHAVPVRLSCVVTRNSDGAVIEWLGLIEQWSEGRMPIGHPAEWRPRLEAVGDKGQLQEYPRILWRRYFSGRLQYAHRHGKQCRPAAAGLCQYRRHPGKITA